MKKTTLLLLTLFITLSASAQEERKPFDFLRKIFKRERPSDPKPKLENSLALSMSPKFYKKRSEAVYNIALIYYGDYYNMDDLTRVQELLEPRFFEATGKQLKLKTLYKAIYPFKHQIQDYPDYRQDYVTDIERLQRLWYYDNMNAKVLKEAWEVTKDSPAKEVDLDKVDALVIISGAQFDALGFASGRVAITENPMEIAWGLSDGGRVEYVTDARVVDELIHEIGHTMFMDHASSQCQKPELTLAERAECCKASPSGDDVMSYCRNRTKVDENFFYGFKDCNRRNLKNKIIPALLSGGEYKIQNREKCI